MPREARVTGPRDTPDLPDYRDKDVIPQPEALDAALAALQQRLTKHCPLCTLVVEMCHCAVDEGLAGELPRPWPEPQ